MNSLELLNKIFSHAIPKGYILVGIKGNVMDLRKVKE